MMNNLPVISESGEILPSTAQSSLTQTHWKDVLDFALQNFEGALAPNTLRAYRADIESYAEFCSVICAAPFPSNDELLIRFGDFLKAKGQVFATIDRKWVAVARINRFVGFGSIGKSEYFKLQRRKLSKELGKRQKQAFGLTKKLLGQLESTCNPDTRIGLTCPRVFNPVET